MNALESLLRRDRWIALGGVCIVTGLAWAYTLAGGGMGMDAFEMTAMTPSPGEPGMPMAQPQWTPGYALVMLTMWWVMMIAMMLPSATPMILLYAAVVRQRRSADSPLTPLVLFVTGYLIAWALFSALATLLQWLLASADLISAMLATSTPWLAGSIMIAAGLYQFTPLKHACLSQCRHPVAFVAGYWRGGKAGALQMGLEHGVVCLGCCWFLMALLFVGGVMNLYWIAALAVFVLLEKVVPRGHWLGRAAGAVLTIWGVLVLVSAQR